MKIKKHFWDIKRNVRVKDIMSTGLHTLDENVKVKDALNVMAKESISAIVIVDKSKPIGIVTERDLIRKVLLKNKDPSKLKLGEVMTKNPKKISPDATILIASNAMKKLSVRRLIVVNKEGNLLGILSQTDIIQSMNKIYESYRSLLWNPLYPMWMIFAVLLLYLVTFLLRNFLK